MPRRPISRAVLAAALCAGLIWACRSAASVVLDLPPPTPGAAEAQERRPAAGAPAPPATPGAPPIERVRDPDSVLAMLPRDSGGGVDWVAAVRQGIVRPRPGPAAPLPQFGFDFFFQAGDPEYDVDFRHSSHSLWLACRGCHSAVYRYRGTKTDMEMIDAGESCGVCHRTVAFTPDACYRCHPAFGVRMAVPAQLGEDIALTRDSAVGDSRYPPARFSHWRHRIRYQCTACHPDQFPMKAGATRVTMDEMKAGVACGNCHDSRTAFGLAACDRCHLMAAPAGPGG